MVDQDKDKSESEEDDWAEDQRIRLSEEFDETDLRVTQQAESGLGHGRFDSKMHVQSVFNE